MPSPLLHFELGEKGAGECFALAYRQVEPFVVGPQSDDVQEVGDAHRLYSLRGRRGV
jgi:hypothetical protein